ncbi:MAG: cytochrome c biogenesis heme-transporting ATPase CcmA [Burkholderiales bacterium]
MTTRTFELQDLACERGERRLFAGLACALASHTLLEVRGANGSGKTSLLRMLCGLLTPAAGTIRWDGTDISTLTEIFRAQIAYLGHASGVKDELTAAENLYFSAKLAAIETDEAGVAAALGWFGLRAYDSQACRTLSQGQRRRVALARLRLSAARPLWILDEPFTALDTHAVDLTRSLIESHVANGGIVVLTTHQDVAIKAPSVQRIELTHA